MNPVTAKHAEHYLRDVNVEQWLDASVVMRPRGMARMPVHSLRSLYILVEPNKNSLPGLDFDEVDEWLIEVIGDTELATDLRQKNAELSYVDRCINLYHTLHQRFNDYANALGVDLVPQQSETAVRPTVTFAQQSA